MLSGEAAAGWSPLAPSYLPPTTRPAPVVRPQPRQTLAICATEASTSPPQALLALLEIRCI